jgi:crossover junction endodeoxyribonuclease RusA
MIKLPVSPSVNSLFRNVRGKGRVKTGAYKAWITEAGLKLNLQRPVPVLGPVHITIRVPDTSRADLDNLAKGPIDLLVAHGLIDDDRHVCALHLIRHGGKEMEIEIKPGTAE